MKAHAIRAADQLEHRRDRTRARPSRAHRGRPSHRRPHRLQSHALRLPLRLRTCSPRSPIPAASTTIRSPAASCARARPSAPTTPITASQSLPSRSSSPPAPARPTVFSSACSAIRATRSWFLSPAIRSSTSSPPSTTFASSRAAGLRPRLADRPRGIPPRHHSRNPRHRPRPSQQSHRPLHQAVGGQGTRSPAAANIDLSLIVDEVFLDYPAPAVPNPSAALSPMGGKIELVGRGSDICGRP